MLNPTQNIPLNREAARLDRFDIVLGLSRSLSTQQLDTLKSMLTRHGFDCLLVDDTHQHPQYLLFLSYNNAVGILKAADHLNIYKKCYSHNLMESKFKLKKLLTQKENKYLDPQIRELEETHKFTFARRKEFLFAPENVQALEDLSTDETKKTSEEVKHAVTAPTAFAKLFKGGHTTLDSSNNTISADENIDSYIGLFTPSELCLIVSWILNSIEIESNDQSFYEIFNVKDVEEIRRVSKRLIDHLRRLELLVFLTPLHNKNLKIGLESINNLTDYFGQNVGIYFKFMEFYTKWLIPPAIFGVIVFLVPTEQSPKLKWILETLYCIMIMIWATLFVEYWQRRSSEICVKWHTYTAQFNAFDSRYDFKGQTRINLVTGLPELYFPFKKKLWRYTKSILAHMPVMLLSFFLMIVFLNAKGYVVPNHSIYIQRLANLSYAGGLFDKATMWKIIPSIMQVGSMVILARINKRISYVTTRWENHETQTGYNNSIIAKRFMFEVLITFLHLFYIVFWRLDFNMLKAEMVILFATDEIRRLVAETAVPYIKKHFLEGEPTAKVVKDEKDAPTQAAYITEKIKELDQQEYDEFDDYLEMIVQYGYITLFAGAFPLSGVFSLLFNGAEVLSDYYKLGNLYRRPMPSYVNGIGTWKNALDIMSYMCVVCNCVLIAISPALSIIFMSEAKTEEAKEEMKDDAFVNIMALEHVMLVVVYLLRKIVKNEPFWVRIYRKRRAYALAN